jgi:hypothetical protein
VLLCLFRLGLSVLYLTTHDKQGFYKHLGYVYCQPIVSLGSASGLLSEELVNVKFLFFYYFDSRKNSSCELYCCRSLRL